MTETFFRRTVLALIWLLSIPVIVYTARLVSHRSLSVLETAHATSAVPAEAFALSLEPLQTASFDLRIPLPGDVSQDDITFENRYMDHALFLTLHTTQRAFFLDNAIFCNRDKVREGTCLLPDGNTIGLLLKTNALFEPVFRLESGAVTVSLTAPFDAAEHVIVLDPLEEMHEGITVLEQHEHRDGMA